MSKITLFIEWLAIIFSFIGVFVIIMGGMKAFLRYLSAFIKKENIDFTSIRVEFIQQILLALEFFVGADLMKTIATPTLDQIGVLAAIVAIRIVFQFSLSREIPSAFRGDGPVPSDQEC